MIKDHTLITLKSLGISPETLCNLLFTHWSILQKSWWLVLNKYQISWVKILEAQRGIESSQSSQGWKTLKTKVKEMKSWQNNQSWNKTGNKKSNSTQGSTLQINWTQSVTELSPKMFWGISCWDELFPAALLLVSHCSWTPTWTRGSSSTSPFLWQCSVLFLFPRWRGASQPGYTAPLIWTTPQVPSCWCKHTAAACRWYAWLALLCQQIL